MQSPASAVCVICGIRPATTRDHVPPKGLFKGVSYDAITVPACVNCNNGASSDDEDLRFMVSVQVGKHTPEAAKLWDEGAHKSVLRKTALRKQFLATAKEIETVDSNGKKVIRIQFEAPKRLYQSVFVRTVRGLYFFHTSRILPGIVQARAELLSHAPDSAAVHDLNFFSIAGGACNYWFGIDDQDSDNSLWVFRVHVDHWIEVRTGVLVGESF